jgi:tRNA(Ile)-lysidine synthase
MQFFLQRLDDALAQLPATNRLLVAFSGGVDSCVLLHALNALRQNHPGRNLLAIHINHQLQTEATQWQVHCQSVCEELGIELRQHVIEVNTAKGESLEARAREMRYRVFESLLEEDDCLLTAHHQDDQAETLLLQLLRGAGPHGLSAMPVIARFGQGYHARPLLNFTRDEIHAYARQHGLQWCEDPSNTNTGFDRNFLRHEIMPRLKQRWPSADQTLSRSALLCADAAAVMDARAGVWLDKVRVPGSDHLSVTALRQLDEGECRNVLRYWLQQSGLPLPAFAHLQAIVHNVILAREDAAPLVQWGDAEVRRYDNALYAMHTLPPHDHQRVYKWDGQHALAVEGVGVLTAQPASALGVSLQCLRQARLTVRFRRGGERCLQRGHQHSQSLKKLMQQWRIPPWQRDRVPLIYDQDELVCVVGNTVCEGYQAGHNEPGVEFRVEAQ